MAIEILVVDDEEMIRSTLREALESEGYRVSDFGNARDFLRYFQEKGGEIILLDIRLPDASGLDLLLEIPKIDPDVPVVVMTAYGDVETAVTAMKRGAYDYLPKPYNLTEVNLLIKKIIQTSMLKGQLNRFREKLETNYSQLIGENVKMKILGEHISMASQSDRTTVLIRGESGTGKELVARQIHLQSSRAAQPFIDVNAAAVTGTLLDSELFGHEKGAFTDAQRQKKGVFELADRGTLFLDEIGDLDPNLQAKLLRVLQERRFRRVGGMSDISVDVRIIAATNANLEIAMEEGRLRRDLFYRLNVFTLFLPTLRERKDDIMLLARSFLDQFRKEFSKDISGFQPDTMEILSNYAFPGNVRELKNLIERAVLLETTNKIRSSSLPEEMHGRPRSQSMTPEIMDPGKPWETPGFNLKIYIDSIERKVVSGAMADTEGKKSKAASLLGLTRFALRHQLKKHGLADDS